MGHDMICVEARLILIDFDDTKTLFICLLIKLFSVSEMYLIPKANQDKDFT